jgi:hypothetical protein
MTLESENEVFAPGAAMTFPILIVPEEGQFAAALVGAPEVRVVGLTRGEAVAALKAEITGRIGRGELGFLEIDTLGVNDLAGKCADDPSLRDICADAYATRDADCPR